MANENKFDSGHAIIPVQVGDGQVDHIAFPIDTPIPELHSALLDHVQSKQPNRDDVLENQKSFKDSSRAAWSSVASGLVAKEAGFNVDKYGRAGTIREHSARNGEVPSVEMGVSPQAMALVHTHPSVGGFSPRPSKNDIEVAKQTKKTVYVVGSQGLFAVDPGGDVTNVYSDPDWMKK